ncbi:hypothetical protein ACOSP7_023790 [Xanthoceras sorbifolium]|uniref:EF-hand domain-containing protein n=1 Tax=Xanthoceras sorbifolium TaxID=99658 RepID=A0ABQ8H9V0_9ROSI|nr:hypothetical protein JRO89_XS13G0248200 [Xanthoceras sorbifolium]
MTMDDESGRASSFLLLIVNFVIIFQDLYSCFRYIIKALLHILLSKRKPRAGAESSSSCLCENVEGHHHEKLTVEEVKMAISEKVITSDSSEIAQLFEEEEVSVEEVKEAFGLFDDNSDGFIDASELSNMLSTLNFSKSSVTECKKMIQAFDDDGDGRIDFPEFVKLLDYSFQSSN